MRMDNRRQSDNFRDRGGGRGGGGNMGGGLPIRTRGLSLPIIIVIGLVLLGINFLAPQPIKDAIFGQIFGGGQTAVSQQGQGATCEAHAERCVFISQVLASTEDVWNPQFAQGRLPNYGVAVTAYQEPVLNVFSNEVSTGCGTAPSSVGPFYCPADSQLYIDPTFYDVMASRLNAPGDFAQAYVIAHEVGHHIQNMIGAMNAGPRESENQHSVRVELQADCLAGVWGHTARADLAIDEADLREALNAAHAIGDDTLQRQSQGYVNPSQYSHGTSEQRMRWFRRGFDSGDARQCDTFAVASYDQL